MYDYACQTGTCGTVFVIVDLVSTWSGAIGQSVIDVSLVAPWLWPLAFGIIGAVLASFTGVVVDRLPKMRGWDKDADETITLSSPASHCDHCSEAIPRQYLIPVAGWLLSKGQCRSCGQAVPLVYPIVEGGSALGSMAIFALLGPSWLAVSLCICLWALILASWFDWQESEIPDFITVPVFFLGALASPLDPDITSRLIGAISSGVVVWIALKVVSLVNSIDAVAYGDVALAVALGAWLGMCGVPYFLVLSCVLYIAYALGARLQGQVWMQFGPALSIGFMIVALFGIRIA